MCLGRALNEFEVDCFESSIGFGDSVKSPAKKFPAKAMSQLSKTGREGFFLFSGKKFIKAV
jgi:hypothetical protein